MQEITGLEQLAREINVRLAKAAEITKRAEEKIAVDRRQAADHRLAAALQLKEARKIVDAAGMPWAVWCRENIKASRSEINRLLKIAGSPEPAAALDANRRAASEGMRRLRYNRREGSNIGAVRAASPDEPGKCGDSSPFDKIKAAIQELDMENLGRLRTWVQEYHDQVLRSASPISRTKGTCKASTVCHSPNGECRYGGCAAADRCLAARKAA